MSGFRVYGLGFRVQGLGSGFRVKVREGRVLFGYCPNSLTVYNRGRINGSIGLYDYNQNVINS